MEITIKRPADVSQKEMDQIVDLIDQGSQIKGGKEAIGNRLKNAVFISFITDGDKIVSTATLKSPTEGYREKVFGAANAESLRESYADELGYIVTAIDREGEKLCQKLLLAFFPLIAERKIFATTRKDAMIHILGKFGFTVTGKPYEKGLRLLIN